MTFYQYRLSVHIHSKHQITRRNQWWNIQRREDKAENDLIYCCIYRIPLSSLGDKFPVVCMCQKLSKLDDSRQSYCKNYLAYFFGPPCICCLRLNIYRKCGDKCPMYIALKHANNRKRLPAHKKSPKSFAYSNWLRVCGIARFIALDCACGFLGLFMADVDAQKRQFLSRGMDVQSSDTLCLKTVSCLKTVLKQVFWCLGLGLGLERWCLVNIPRSKLLTTIHRPLDFL